jgi:uncharacterized membrane protein YphA (DoxX/SURF4 family)
MPEFHKAEDMPAFVDDAVKKGARVVNAGGGTACETLYFPAVVYPVRPGMELYTKEQFGPVVPVCAYQDEQEFLNYVALGGFIQGALHKTGGAHPDVQGWYAGFLQNIVLTHVHTWSHLVAYGELLVGLALTIGFLTGIAAFCGLFINLNYLLAGTVSTNPILFHHKHRANSRLENRWVRWS